eukprot:8547284-Alexandrium_andersonii.AAC.1
MSSAIDTLLLNGSPKPRPDAKAIVETHMPRCCRTQQSQDGRRKQQAGASPVGRAAKRQARGRASQRGRRAQEASRAPGSRRREGRADVRPRPAGPIDRTSEWGGSEMRQRGSQAGRGPGGPDRAGGTCHSTEA